MLPSLFITVADVGKLSYYSKPVACKNTNIYSAVLLEIASPLLVDAIDVARSEIIGVELIDTSSGKRRVGLQSCNAGFWKWVGAAGS